MVLNNTRVSTDRRTVLKAMGTSATAATIGLAGCLGDEDGEFPTQDIRVIVPYSEGGGTDVFARNMQEALEEELGQSLQIENVEGAAGLNGMQEAHGDAGESHTVVMLNPPAEVLMAISEDNPDIFLDLEGVGIYGSTAWTIIAHPDHEIEGISDMLDRFEDGEFTDVGGQEPGSVQHALANIMQNDDHDWQWENYVAYPGTGPVAEAVVSQEIPVGIGTENGVQQTVDAGEAEVVAVLSSQGSSVFPDEDSNTDHGYPNLDFIGHQNRAWYAPPDTPEEDREVLAEALEAAAGSDDVQDWAEETGNNVEWAGGIAEAEQVVEEGFDEIEANMDTDLLDG